MLRLLCPKLLHQVTTRLRDPTAAAAAASHPHLLQHPFPKPYSGRSINSKEPSSFTVSFLTSSCGLSADAALSVAQRVQFKTVGKALSVVALLKDYGFSDAQIDRLVTREPRVLTYRPDKTLKPKLEFYRGIGLVGAGLPKLLAASPWPLVYSLKSRLLPNSKILKSILGTNENVVAALKNSPTLILEDCRKVVLPKIEALRAYGVADAVIVMLLTTYANAFLPRSARFSEAFDAVKEMGVSPSNSMFAHALGVFAQMPGKLWEQKLENFKSLGWSRDQVLLAYARHPQVMWCSAEKIRKSMRFLGEKLEWGPDYLSTYPVLLSLSLEKRMIPRYTVLHILMSKGLLKVGFSATQFMMGEEKFLRKYVIKYQYEAPQIVDIFKDLKPEWSGAD